MTSPTAKKKWAVSGIVLAAIVISLLLLVITRPDPPGAVSEERAWPVAVVIAQPGDHRPRLRLQGFLESPRTVTLKAAVEADVAIIAHDEGETVSQDALLIGLDDAEARFALDERAGDVAELEAQKAIEERRVAADRNELALEEELLELARREARRLENLSDGQHVSQSDLERAQRTLQQQKMALSSRQFAVDTAESRLAQIDARLQRARAMLGRAELNLDRTRIKAPFDGRIAALETAPGDRVGPGTPLVTFYGTDALEIRAQIPRIHLPRLRQALANGDLQAGAWSDGQQIPLTLSRLAGQSGAGEGGAQALFRVTGDSDDLILGRFADVTLDLNPEPDTLLLPFESLYETRRIYRVRDDRLEAIEVETLGEAPLGSGRAGVVVRAPDIRAGDNILATQLPQAMHSLRVRIDEAGE